jgi:hypothetical protein
VICSFFIERTPEASTVERKERADVRQSPHDDIKFLPADVSESKPRSNLTTEEPRMVDGQIPLPTPPGLALSST